MPKQYIIRLNFGRRGTRYGTIPPEGLQVNYRSVHRPTGRRLGGMFTEVKEVGKDKSTVLLRFPGSREDNTIINDRGSRGLYPGNASVKLLDRHETIRAVAQEDLDELARRDAEIRAKQMEVKAMQDERAEFMKGVWRRAGKLAISELEEMVS